MDCLFACDECKVETCLFHNRAPVVLSVADQDLTRKEAANATSRTVVDPAAPPSPSPLPETKGSSVETVARLDTGSSRRNFTRQDLAEELISRGSKVVAVEGEVKGRF